MATDASAPFPADLHRALEQAVGNANNAADLTKRKRSKRVRDEVNVADASGAEAPVKKKKKSKSHSHEDSPAGEGQITVVQVDPSTSVTPGGDGEAELSGGSSKKKKKKSKKGKEKETSVESIQDVSEPQPEVSPNTDIVTSSADFLNAVVAAASATSGQPHGQPPYDPSMPQPSQFLPYPPQHPDFGSFQYPPPPGHLPPFAPQAHGQAPPVFADPNGMLPDLQFTSSEDLLRTLQEFDLSKVMHVLRSLGDAANAANVSVTMPPQTGPPPAPPPVINKPVGSEAILGRPPRQRRPPQGQGQGAVSMVPAPPHIPPHAPMVAPPVAAVMPPPPPLPPAQEGNPEHAHMLANVWMNAQKLAEMVKKEGLVYKKGKFSAIEEAQLSAAIEHYRVTKGLTQDQLNELIFSKERGRDTFWQEITSALHLRPIIAVYHHVRRNRHPLSQQGKWMETEDELLIGAVAQHGQQWERVSHIVGRMAGDCRDRWRNHLEDRATRRNGTWSKEEEEELTRIVTEMTVEQGRDIDSEVFWGIVSQRMGGKRGRQQCRIKWTDTLSSQMKNSGERPRWSQLDAYILVHKVDSLNVRDDTEIDWKLLPDENWNVWSAHALQRRWLTMKRSIKGYEEMSHAEIMEILKTKKSHVPGSSTGRKKKNKVTSAEAVVDVDDGDGNMVPVAGPSSVALTSTVV